MIEANRRILLYPSGVKTRVDVLAGGRGAGKTALAARMIESCGGSAEKTLVCRGGPDWADTMDGLRRALRINRPGRLLLELPGNLLLEDFPAALARLDLRGEAFAGTRVFVLDGESALSGATPATYVGRQVRHSSVVVVNRAGALDPEEKLELFGRIWSANRYVHLLVDPLTGIDLWRVFDSCMT